LTVASVDLRGRTWRSADVEDHVPRLLLRRVDAERHPRAPLLVEPLKEFAELLKVLFREVDHPEVQIELVLRRPSSVESDRDRAIELVPELSELLDQFV